MIELLLIPEMYGGVAIISYPEMAEKNEWPVNKWYAESTGMPPIRLLGFLAIAHSLASSLFGAEFGFISAIVVIFWVYLGHKFLTELVGPWIQLYAPILAFAFGAIALVIQLT
jgi:hypothetical protein